MISERRWIKDGKLVLSLERDGHYIQILLSQVMVLELLSSSSRSVPWALLPRLHLTNRFGGSYLGNMFGLPCTQSLEVHSKASAILFKYAQRAVHQPYRLEAPEVTSQLFYFSGAQPVPPALKGNSFKDNSVKANVYVSHTYA